MSNQTVHFTAIREKIIETLLSAKSEISIAVAWFTDEKIIDVLNRCANKGVSISVIIYDDKINNKELFRNLYYKKADIRFSEKLMHNKFCIIDNHTVINGSYNWTHNASTNHENIQITVSNILAESFQKEFDRILKKSKSVDRYFADNQDAFNNYLNQIGKPIKYPVFCRLDINNIIKRRVFTIESEYNTLEKLNDVYVLFYNEIDFSSYFQKIYQTLHTTTKSHISLSSKVKQEKDVYSTDTYGVKSSFLVIDIIRPSDINFVKNISAEDYINNNFRFTNEKFIYFDDYQKDNILLIGFITDRFNTKLQDKLLLMSIKNTSGFNQVIKIEYNLLNFSDKYISSVRESVDILDSPYFHQKRTLIRYDIFIKIENFEVDNDYSRKVYRNNHVEVENRLLKERDERAEKKEREKIKPVNNNQGCYIATLVYQDIDHPKVEFLRKFRDEKLLSTYLGTLFVKLYYKTSPKLVTILKPYSKIQKIIRFTLDKLISVLQ